MNKCYDRVEMLEISVGMVSNKPENSSVSLAIVVKATKEIFKVFNFFLSPKHVTNELIF